MSRKPNSRIFPRLVNKAAFVDKIVLSVDGKLKSDFEYELLDPKNHGILRPGMLYCRSVSGIFELTGNPAVVRYGKAKKFKNVPAVQVVMQSEAIPVTAAQVMFLVKRLTSDPPPITVSQLELTLDVTGTTIDYILQHLIQRARGDVRVLSDGKRRTIYVGSPRSKWEVRIYQKRRSVLRLEFILRRPFLSKHGINQPEDVLLLRKVRIWDLLSIRRFSASSATRVTKTWRDAFWRDVVMTWGRYGRELSGITGFLRGYGVHPHRVLRRTRLQRRLEAMQRRLVW